MRVSVRWIEFNGVPHVLNRFFRVANFVEYAAKIEMPHHAIGFKFERGAKLQPRLFEFSSFVKHTAQIDVRLAPARLHFNHTAVQPHGLFRPVRLGLAAHGILENLFRCRRLHFKNFLTAAGRAVKRENELSCQRFDCRTGEARSYRGDLPAIWEKLKFAKRSANGLASFQGSDNAADFASRNVALNNGLD